MIDAEHPEHGEAVARLSPTGQFPVLVDGDTIVVESSATVEYLDLAGEAQPMVPQDRHAAIEVRQLDRIFDDYVAVPMQAIVGDALRPEAARDPHGVSAARATLDKSYGWLDRRMAGREWAAGAGFGLADCAAAPALFYADWVHPIPAEHAALRGYRARLLARRSIARVVDEARPYRPLFPLGAPDRDGPRRRHPTRLFPFLAGILRTEEARLAAAPGRGGALSDSPHEVRETPPKGRGHPDGSDSAPACA